MKTNFITKSTFFLLSICLAWSCASKRDDPSNKKRNLSGENLPVFSKDFNLEKVDFSIKQFIGAYNKGRFKEAISLVKCEIKNKKYEILWLETMSLHLGGIKKYYVVDDKKSKYGHKISGKYDNAKHFVKPIRTIEVIYENGKKSTIEFVVSSNDYSVLSAFINFNALSVNQELLLKIDSDVYKKLPNKPKTKTKYSKTKK